MITVLAGRALNGANPNQTGSQFPAITLQNLSDSDLVGTTITNSKDRFERRTPMDDLKKKVSTLELALSV